MQKELELLHGVEAELGKEMEEFECKEKDVLADITKVSVEDILILTDSF